MREESKPISGDTGLREIQQLAGEVFVEPHRDTGRFSLESYQKVSNLDAYIEHILGYIKPAELKPVKLVVNAGNGAAGHVIDAIEERFQSTGVPVQFVKIHHEPDGNFPHGIPNPLLPDGRQATVDAVLEHRADMGIAWDGDFDRCFLFDEKGSL